MWLTDFIAPIRRESTNFMVEELTVHKGRRLLRCCEATLRMIETTSAQWSCEDRQVEVDPSEVFWVSWERVDNPWPSGSWSDSQGGL